MFGGHHAIFTMGGKSISLDKKRIEEEKKCNPK